MVWPFARVVLIWAADEARFPNSLGVIHFFTLT